MLLPYRDKLPDVDRSAFVAGTATVVGDVTVGPGSSVWFGAVLRGDVNTIRVGARTSIQEHAILHSDADAPCTVGDGVTIGHQAVVHGCTVENGAVIGIGAIVLNHARVGEGAVIGAGALVKENAHIPPNTLAVGIPAKPVRLLTDEDRKRFEENAAHYVKLGEEYRQAL
jgi:carbonic anhydrase/acetyltransferase-like protein (isoleucine patch superfamily)